VQEPRGGDCINLKSKWAMLEALVRDMWLTGFDAPCLHLIYADKPMQGHGLMQAIARVNRVFKDKSGGLIVELAPKPPRVSCLVWRLSLSRVVVLGLAERLKRALATYTEAGGQGNPTYDMRQAHRREPRETRQRLRHEA